MSKPKYSLIQLGIGQLVLKVYAVGPNGGVLWRRIGKDIVFKTPAEAIEAYEMIYGPLGKGQGLKIVS